HPAYPAPYPQHGLLEHAANVVVGSAAAGIAATIIFSGQSDKLKHAVITSAISGIVSEATGHWWAGVGAAIAVGVAKELVDGSPRRHALPGRASPRCSLPGGAAPYPVHGGASGVTYTAGRLSRR